MSGEGMSAVRAAMGKLVAAVALASGLAIASPARADTWQDAVRDADDLHEAAEDLYDRAVRLHDHHAMPVTAALDDASAALYHGLKHQPSAAEIVPLLNRTQAMLSEVDAVMALSCDLHTDRKAIALLKDVRHHFADTAEHVECILHDHHGHHAAPTVRYYQPQPAWPSSHAAPYGNQYTPPPAWLGQPAPPVVWGSGYRGASQSSPYGTDQYHRGARVQSPRSLPRVVISGVFVR